PSGTDPQILGIAPQRATPASAAASPPTPTRDTGPAPPPPAATATPAHAPQTTPPPPAQSPDHATPNQPHRHQQQRQTIDGSYPETVERRPSKRAPSASPGTPVPTQLTAPRQISPRGTRRSWRERGKEEGRTRGEWGRRGNAGRGGVIHQDKA